MKDLTPELHFSAVRSSGPGGQNVNKTASKVEVRFQVAASLLLTDEEKARLLEKVAGRLSHDGWLIVTAQTERSQLKNKALAVEKFYHLLAKALELPKTRKATRPSAAAVRQRRETKLRQSEKKSRRQQTDF